MRPITANKKLVTPTVLAALRIAFVGAAVLLALPATAALYKWVDASGRTVYSDQPPTSTTIQAEKLNPVAPASNPNASKELAQKDFDMKKRQADRVEATSKSDKDRAAKEKRAEDCTQIAGAIRQYSWGQVVIMRVNEKGEHVAMDDAERAKEKARLEGVYKEQCTQ